MNRTFAKVLRISAVSAFGLIAMHLLSPRLAAQVGQQKDPPKKSVSTEQTKQTPASEHTTGHEDRLEKERQEEAERQAALEEARRKAEEALEAVKKHNEGSNGNPN